MALIVPPDSPIIEAQEFVTGTNRHGFRRRGDAMRGDDSHDGPGDLRRRSFAQGERVLPSFSFPRPRRTGWEEW